MPRTDSTWIQSYSGKAVWPLDPLAEDIELIDIAHALAFKCRYAGHTREFYSVAQHSVLVSLHVAATDALWGLLHDAAEAYLPDVCRPVKKHLAGFSEIEDRLLSVIATKYGLGWPMPQAVHAADMQALATERRDLLATPPLPWLLAEDVQPWPQQITAWPPLIAEARFVARFVSLTGRQVE